MAEERQPSPAEQIKSLYEENESRTAKALEELVARDSFGEVLAKVTENVVGLTKIATDTFDLILRNLRVAGRQDITRLARQLARTEDKLERVLQEIEALRAESSAPTRRSSGGGSRSSNGRSSNGRSSSRRQTSRARSGGEGS